MENYPNAVFIAFDAACEDKILAAFISVFRYVGLRKKQDL